MDINFYIFIFNPDIDNYKVNYEYTEKRIYSIKLLQLKWISSFLNLYLNTL